MAQNNAYTVGSLHLRTPNFRSKNTVFDWRLVESTVQNLEGQVCIYWKKPMCKWTSTFKPTLFKGQLQNTTRQLSWSRLTTEGHPNPARHLLSLYTSLSLGLFPQVGHNP